MPTVDPRDAELAAKNRYHVEGQTSTLGPRWQIWDGEAHSARFKNIADFTDAHNICAELNTRPEHLAGSGVAGELEALACDCDNGEDNNWEDHEWRDTAALLRSAAAALRTRPPEPVAADVAGEIAAAVHDGPRAADDSEFMAAWETLGFQYSDSNIDKVHIGWRMANALRAHPAPEQSAHCSGEVVEVVARAPAFTLDDERKLRLETEQRILAVEMAAVQDVRKALEPFRALIDRIEGIFGWGCSLNDRGERLKDDPVYVAAYLAAHDERYPNKAVSTEDDRAALSAPRPEEGVTQEQRNEIAREIEGDSDHPLRVAEANAIYDGKRGELYT
jgi:hypothetical protein